MLLEGADKSVLQTALMLEGDVRALLAAHLLMLRKSGLNQATSQNISR
jgi:hypothetical protein